MRIAVAGVNGFVGQHLVRELNDQRYEVIGIGREREPNSKIDDILSEYIVCDLSKIEQVLNIPLESIDSLINTAGLAKVGVGEEERDRYVQINSSVQVNICESVKKLKSRTRVVSISTGAVYDTSQPMPLSEDSPLDTSKLLGVYAESKIKMEKALTKYTDFIDLVIARPFNHSGPGQLPGFLIPDITEQLINIMGDKILTGNLNTKRDYTDVRDVVRAYVLLATTPKLNYSIYNICSGISRSGRDILNLLCAELAIPIPDISLDPDKIRKHDIMDIYGNHNRISSDTGWNPEIPFDQTIRDFITWRKAEI